MSELVDDLRKVLRTMLVDGLKRNNYHDVAEWLAYLQWLDTIAPRKETDANIRSPKVPKPSSE